MCVSWPCQFFPPLDNCSLAKDHPVPLSLYIACTLVDLVILFLLLLPTSLRSLSAQLNRININNNANNTVQNPLRQQLQRLHLDSPISIHFSPSLDIFHSLKLNHRSGTISRTPLDKHAFLRPPHDFDALRFHHLCTHETLISSPFWS